MLASRAISLAPEMSDPYGVAGRVGPTTQDMYLVSEVRLHKVEDAEHLQHYTVQGKRRSLARAVQLASPDRERRLPGMHACLPFGGCGLQCCPHIGTHLQRLSYFGAATGVEPRRRTSLCELLIFLLERMDFEPTQAGVKETCDDR